MSKSRSKAKKRHDANTKAHRRIAKTARVLDRSKKRGNTFNAVLIAALIAVGNFLGGLDVSVTIPHVDLGPIEAGPITITNTGK